MSDIPDRTNLLDEIDVRQDELLRSLEELDNRVQSVLKGVLSGNGQTQEAQ